MKLSAKTILALKNLANINNSIFISPGNILSTISSGKNILAKITVEDEFPIEFAIYNLGRFINCLSLFKEPELIFDTNSVKITSGNQSILYHFTSKENILIPSTTEIKLPSVEVECVVTKDNIVGLMKALNFLGDKDISIVGKDGKIYLQTYSISKSSADTYSIELGETDKVFCAIINAENLKILDGDYKVSISSKLFAEFKGITVDATYWIAMNKDSRF